jgi:hypothetical protein
MATGDQSDMVARMRAVLPRGWFASTAATDASSTPYLDAVLAGIASVWAYCYALYAYAALQTRIATATDAWLDMIAFDFFGLNLRRRTNEQDAALSTRIRASLLPPANTRAALITVLTNLTGRTPVMFEPMNAGDAGCLNTTMGLGIGALGSLTMPRQVFVIAYRPSGGGIANVAGLGTSGGGGLGVGSFVTVGQSQVQASIADSEIYATVAQAMPVCGTAWVSISS